MNASTLGERIRNVRRRRGLTQRELATAAGVSMSLIKKLEQGQITDVRLATARKVAVALKVPTMDIVSPERPEQQETPGAGIWSATRDALLSPQAPPDEHADGRGTADALLDAVKLYHANRYDRLALVLPALIRDARDAPPLTRSRVMQLAGSVMTQTQQRDAARAALEQSVADAEATGSNTDAASAIVTMCWLMLTEGRFEDVRRLAANWADRTEPRLSTATIPEVSAWGWLLLRGSAAAIRDNRSDEAADMMTLAEAAAVVTRTERKDWRHYWTTFGPATVAMKRTENALIDGRPDIALRLADHVPGQLSPTSDNRNRHLLDVAAAHAELRHYNDSVAVLKQLNAESGPWLAQQRLARDTLGRVIARRRTLTPDMRQLADAIDVPL